MAFGISQKIIFISSAFVQGSGCESWPDVPGRKLWMFIPQNCYSSCWQKSDGCSGTPLWRQSGPSPTGWVDMADMIQTKQLISRLITTQNQMNRMKPLTKILTILWCCQSLFVLQNSIFGRCFWLGGATGGLAGCHSHCWEPDSKSLFAALACNKSSWWHEFCDPLRSKRSVKEAWNCAMPWGHD